MPASLRPTRCEGTAITPSVAHRVLQIMLKCSSDQEFRGPRLTKTTTTMTKMRTVVEKAARVCVLLRACGDVRPREEVAGPWLQSPAVLRLGPCIQLLDNVTAELCIQ